MKLTFLIFLLASSLTISAQEKLLKPYDSIFIEAQKNDKNIILVFGHQYCAWCRVFDRYHANQKTKEILEPEFIIHKIDIIESEAG